MKKNLYFRNTVQRQNVLREFILSAFLMLSAYPRLMIEVFIRKDFGERYFKISSAITAFVIFAGAPFLLQWFEDTGEEETRSTVAGNQILYIYLGLFILFSIKRYLETRRNPSVFDTEKYSLYGGTIHPVFEKVRIRGKKPSIRLIETVLEPIPFFIAGVILWMLNQSLGILLVTSSIFYSLSYVALYDRGDNYVMDMLDQMILNEMLEDAFVKDKDPSQTKGVRTLGRKPADEDIRREVFKGMMEEEEVYTVT